MDPTVQVAVFGLFGTAILGLSAVVVAIINNKKERGDTADVSISETLEQQIQLKDERLKFKDEIIQDLREELVEKVIEIAHLKEQISELTDEVVQMKGTQ